MARLTIIEGTGAGGIHLITPQGLTIGRLAINEVCLPDEQVSRQHARVEYWGDSCYITDLGSRNGIRVNGVQITEKALAPGDVITIGKNLLRFEEGPLSTVELLDSPPLVPGGGTIVKAFDGVAATTPERHLRVLYAAGKALLSSSDLTDLLNLIMDLVFRELPAKRGFLLLLDKDTGELKPTVVRAGETGCDGNVTISRTIAETALKEKVGVLTSDAATDPRFCSGESVFLYNIHSALCVPLLNEDEVMGVLYIDADKNTYCFTEEDLDLLSAMANLSAIGIQKQQLARKAREEEELRGRLARYHSPDVVEHIMREGLAGGAGTLSVSEKEVTVLFSDIKGFTSISERLEPQQVAEILNEYFTRMTDIVFEYGGTLDKYIGDAIMALFGAPFSKEDDAERAVHAAIKMQKELAALMGRGSTKEKFSVRIGINTGMVVAGNIGSPRRVDYTVLGDAVNVAQRLESIAQPGQILIGGSTCEKVKGRFKLNEIGMQRVKGKDEEVMVYEVLG